MSTDFRATQMQAEKYIWFVSTQELRTRAMGAKRRHYRIIARTKGRIMAHWRARSRKAHGKALARTVGPAMRVRERAGAL